jgi:ribose transport system permease protein
MAEAIAGRGLRIRLRFGFLLNLTLFGLLLLMWIVLSFTTDSFATHRCGRSSRWGRLS